MKKKLLLIFCFLILGVCCALACTACEGSVKNPHAHDFYRVNSRSATCTEDGNITYYVCNICDGWFKDNLGKNEITDRKSVIIPKGHKTSPVAAKEPTCTKNGNIAYYVCNSCGKWFEDVDGKKQITDETSIVVYMTHKFKDNFCTACGIHEPTKGLIYTDEGDYIEVAGMGTATDTEIYIADIYNGKPVTSIGGDAFRDCVNLKRINLPDSLTKISDGAFEGCSSLESIKIPDEVTYIGTWAFSECIGLTEIVIPDKVPRLEAYAFENCVNLKRITVGRGVRTIDDDAFYGCVGLKDITFNGTRQQWLNIYKMYGWDNFLGDYNVHCTDANFIAGHKLTYFSAESATCAKDGNKAYYSCNNCGKYFNDSSANNEITDKTSVIIPRLGHKLTRVEARDSACNQFGNPVYYACSVCTNWFMDEEGKDEVADKTSVVTKLPHNFADKVCTECGYHEPTEGLNYTDKGDYIEVSGIGAATDAYIYIADEYNSKPVTTIVM